MKERLWRYFIEALEEGITAEYAPDWFYGAVDFSFKEKRITRQERDELLERRDGLLEQRNGTGEDENGR